MPAGGWHVALLRLQCRLSCWTCASCAWGLWVTHACAFDSIVVPQGRGCGMAQRPVDVQAAQACVVRTTCVYGRIRDGSGLSGSPWPPVCVWLARAWLTARWCCLASRRSTLQRYGCGRVMGWGGNVVHFFCGQRNPFVQVRRCVRLRGHPYDNLSHGACLGPSTVN